MPVRVVEVDPECEMLRLAADVGVPEESVRLGAGLLQRIMDFHPALPCAILRDGRVRGIECGKDAPFDDKCGMLMYAACVSLANKAFGWTVTWPQRMALHRWAKDILGITLPRKSVVQLELACLHKLDWKL